MFSSIIVGLTSQLWLRKYHPGWYRKYNYILGGALDGGAQVMVFILSFAVFGASGIQRPFPSVRIFLFFYFFWFYLQTISSIFSGQEILLKEILTIVMATGHWIEINVVGWYEVCWRGKTMIELVFLKKYFFLFYYNSASVGGDYGMAFPAVMPTVFPTNFKLQTLWRMWRINERNFVMGWICMIIPYISFLCCNYLYVYSFRCFQWDDFMLFVMILNY